MVLDKPWECSPELLKQRDQKVGLQGTEDEECCPLILGLQGLLQRPRAWGRRGQEWDSLPSVSFERPISAHALASVLTSKSEGRKEEGRNLNKDSFQKAPVKRNRSNLKAAQHTLPSGSAHHYVEITGLLYLCNLACDRRGQGALPTVWIRILRQGESPHRVPENVQSTRGARPKDPHSYLLSSFPLEE